MPHALSFQHRQTRSAASHVRADPLVWHCVSLDVPDGALNRHPLFPSPSLVGSGSQPSCSLPHIPSSSQVVRSNSAMPAGHHHRALMLVHLRS